MFQQTLGIPIIFQSSIKIYCNDEKKPAKQFSLTFRYIDEVLSLTNYKFSDSIDLIYPNELEIKDTRTLLYIWLATRIWPSGKSTHSAVW